MLAHVPATAELQEVEVYPLMSMAWAMESPAREYRADENFMLKLRMVPVGRVEGFKVVSLELSDWLGYNASLLHQCGLALVFIRTS